MTTAPAPSDQAITIAPDETNPHNEVYHNVKYGKCPALRAPRVPNLSGRPETLAGMIALYVQQHPDAMLSDVTLSEFCAWWVTRTHKYYAEGSSKLPCDACGMSWAEHNTKEKVSP